MTTSSKPPTNGHKTINNGDERGANGYGQAKQAIPRHTLHDTRSTYPSQSLRFLQGLAIEQRYGNQKGHWPRYPEPARLRLKIVIVGAGLGGLALAIALARRGHSVRVLEQAPRLGEVCRKICLHLQHSSQLMALGWRRNSDSAKFGATPTGMGRL